MAPSNEKPNERRQYSLVPPNSWCKYQVDQINDTWFYDQQYCLPAVFRSELHYIFTQLPADPLFQNCQGWVTENQN